MKISHFTVPTVMLSDEIYENQSFIVFTLWGLGG